MTSNRCPGQDKRFWKLKDIVEVKCPYCGKDIEFWKDDPMRYCPHCGELISNPAINLSCAKWCKSAADCLGDVPEEAISASPIIERLKALLHKELINQPARMQNALDALLLAETMMMKEEGNPSLIKPAVLFAGVLFKSELVPETDQNEANERLGNIDSWVELMDKAGIEEPNIKKICDLIQTTLDDQRLENDESAIIWDTIQLERLILLEEEDDLLSEAVSEVESLLQTNSGKQMLKRFKK